MAKYLIILPSCFPKLCPENSLNYVGMWDSVNCDKTAITKTVI